MRILIVEDDQDTADILKRELLAEDEDNDVDHAADDHSGLSMALEGGYDAIVLDLVLDPVSERPAGMNVLKRLRKRGVMSQVLVLSGARNDVRDKITLLEAGADDFMDKPYSVEELIARLHALNRRFPDRGSTSVRKLQFGDLILSVESREVTRGDKKIDLTPREFDLLKYLMEHPNTVLTYDQIVTGAWNIKYKDRANLVHATVRNLRRKIQDGNASDIIQTQWSMGYIIRGTVLRRF